MTEADSGAPTAPVADMRPAANGATNPPQEAAQTIHGVQNGATTSTETLDETMRRAIGQLFVVVFDGYSVGPEIRHLIEKYYVGGVLLTPRNIRDSQQLAALTQELQQIAQAAGYTHPLIIAIEQENGMISRFGDGVRATHFPGAMALGATRTPQLAFDVAQATAKELAAAGINWNMAPVLNAYGEDGNTAVNVRSFGDNPQTVAQFASAFVDGLKAGGVGHCGKHFPSMGISPSKIDPAIRSPADVSDLLQFRKASIPSMSAVMLGSSIWPGATDPTESITEFTRAKHIIGDVLRAELGFDGVTLCDVTSMPLLVAGRTTIGEAAQTAVEAGADLLLVYHTAGVQIQVIDWLRGVVQNHRLSPDLITRSAAAIARLKTQLQAFTWQTAIERPHPQHLAQLMQQHQALARSVYDASTTVVRNTRGILPLRLNPKDRILLLTPVVRPLHHRAPGEPTMDPFEPLGRAIAARQKGVMHLPYTAHGMTATHINHINMATAVVFVTVNAKQPNAEYQAEFAAEVMKRCTGKALVNLAACDPADLVDQQNFDTYICTYEYSAGALAAAAGIIFGERPATGVLPVGYAGKKQLEGPPSPHATP